MNLTATQIVELGETLAHLNEIDRPRRRIRRVTLDVEGARVALSRGRNSYNALALTKVESK